MKRLRRPCWHHWVARWRWRRDRQTSCTHWPPMQAQKSGHILVTTHACLRNEDVANAVVFMLSQPPHVTIRDLVMLPQNQDL